MKKAHIWILLGILALGAFFRFYLIAEVPLGLYPDEAMNGNNALEALATGDFKIFYPENNGREGLFINIQALSVATFGNTPWALRIVSALFGTLTIAGVYLAAREIFQRRGPALLAAFFIATSYWHINFSRIGFRAIMVPFCATFALYFLLKGLRRGSTLDIALAGIFTGLGLHTYIAFRLMAPVFALPLVWYLWQWKKARDRTQSGCAPCAVALYAFIVFVVVLPLIIHFAQNPLDFSDRANGVSVFAAASPPKAFAKSTALTLQMFFFSGDCNWRHNFNCAPQLHPIVALFLLVGIIALWRLNLHRWKKAVLATWVICMAFPAALTREGIPHALRTIGMIPPLVLLAGLGADRVCVGVGQWIEKEKACWPQYTGQLGRLRYELLFLFVLVLLAVPFMTYRAYFLHWSNHPKTYEAFDTSNYHMGQYLAGLPKEIKKYVVVNARGVDVRGIPMPSQTVMFVTDSFTPAGQSAADIHYIVVEPGHAPLPAEITSAEKTVIAFIDGADIPGITASQAVLPTFRLQVPGDFVILQNF
ncbi:MAG: glycosyltransferase family 39 protein [Patescibacteria group bacterium]